MRGLAGTIAFAALTLSVKHVPLSIFQVLQNILPFLTALLACIFLKETITLFEFIAMILCFAGIVIVAMTG